jgi:hypothetical protein
MLGKGGSNFYQISSTLVRLDFIGDSSFLLHQAISRNPLKNLTQYPMTVSDLFIPLEQKSSHRRLVA